MALPALGAPRFLLVVGSALRGIVDGILLLAWVSLLSKLRGQGIGVALAEAVLVYAIAAAAIPEVALFSPVAATVLMALCPLGTGLGYIVAAKKTHEPEIPSTDQEPLSTKLQVVFIANNILYGFILGVLQHEVFKINYDLAAFALVVFALIMFAIFIFYSRAADFGRGFRWYAVVASIGLLICALTYGICPHFTTVVLVLLWGLQVFFNTMIFADVQFTAVGYSINPGSVGLCTLGMGLLLAAFLPDAAPKNINMLVAVSAQFVTIVYTVALFLPRTGKWTSDWGFSSYSIPESRESFLSRRCEEVATEYELTRREAEIAQMLAQGKSNSDISEMLFISPHTTKTHIRNMYAKLDIHSQHDFIDLLTKGRQEKDNPPRNNS